MQLKLLLWKRNNLNFEYTDKKAHKYPYIFLRIDKWKHLLLQQYLLLDLPASKQPLEVDDPQAIPCRTESTSRQVILEHVLSTLIEILQTLHATH